MVANKRNRRLLGGLLGFCSVLLIAQQTLFAQSPAVASLPLQVNASDLHRMWFQALDALRKGDIKNIDAALLSLSDLNLKKLQIGFHNLSDCSRILIQEADNVKKQAGAQKAMEILDAALRLSPELPDVHFALAKMRLAVNMADAYRATLDFARGVWFKYTESAMLMTYLNNGLTIFGFAGILASIVFILFSFIYYHRAICYQIKEKFPVELPLLFAQILVWLLIAAVTLGLGVAWGMLFLAALLIWHLDVSAKRLLQAVLAFSAVFALFVIVIGITLATSDGEYYQALCDLARGEFSSQTAAVLQNRLKDFPEDVSAIFGLAFIAQKNGHLDEAIQAFSMIPEQFTDWAAAQNNLGNLYQKKYRKKQGEQWYQKAEEAYNNALFRAPKMFEPNFNYAQLLLEQQKSTEAGEYINKARKLNHEQYTLQSEYLKDQIFSIDASFSTWGLLRRVFYQDFSAAGMTVAKRLWGSVSRFDQPIYFAIAAGVVFLASLMFGVQKNAPHKSVMYCQMCGEPYAVKRSKKTQDVETFCTQCTYIFKKKTAVKPEKRAEKVKQIQLRQNIRNFLVKLFSVCVPGAGQVYFGYPLKGALIALLFFAGVFYYLFHEFVRVLLVSSESLGFSWLAIGFFGLLAGGSYLFNLMDAFKISPKNQ